MSHHMTSPMIKRINAIKRLEALRRIVWYALVLSVIVGGYLWSMGEEPDYMAGHVDAQSVATVIMRRGGENHAPDR